VIELSTILIASSNPATSPTVATAARSWRIGHRGAVCARGVEEQDDAPVRGAGPQDLEQLPEHQERAVGPRELQADAVDQVDRCLPGDGHDDVGDRRPVGPRELLPDRHQLLGRRQRRGGQVDDVRCHCRGVVREPVERVSVRAQQHQLQRPGIQRDPIRRKRVLGDRGRGRGRERGGRSGPLVWRPGRRIDKARHTALEYLLLR
jgi:hypothetical protein